MNVISAVEGPDGRLFRGICHALAAAFAEVRVYCVGRPDRPGEVQNLMLLAFPEAVPEGERQVPLIVAQLPSRPLREFLQQLGQMGPKGGRFHGRLPPDGRRHDVFL